jgi:hypothetical protein
MNAHRRYVGDTFATLGGNNRFLYHFFVKVVPAGLKL